MEQSWSADYRVGDCVYKIFEKSELHSRLNSDEEFLKKYVSESTTNTEFVKVIDNDADIKEEMKTFKWETKPTKYFVQLYMDRRDKFRDPKIRKKGLWAEIARNMNQAGYNVDEDTIDRKMRNMKKTYRTIKQNIKNSGGGHVKWGYFEAFEEMFSEDITINSDPLATSMTTSRTDTSLNSTALSSSASCNASSLDEYEPPPKIKKTQNTKKTVKVKKIRSMQYMRKKMLKVEARKAAASEDLNRILRKTNKILQERNDLLRRFLDTRRTEY